MGIAGLIMKLFVVSAVLLAGVALAEPGHNHNHGHRRGHKGGYRTRGYYGKREAEPEAAAAAEANTEAMVVSATTERGTLMLRLVIMVTMERGGAMATGDTGPEATTTARGRPRLRLVTMVIMEERTGAMATG